MLDASPSGWQLMKRNRPNRPKLLLPLFIYRSIVIPCQKSQLSHTPETTKPSHKHSIADSNIDPSIHSASVQKPTLSTPIQPHQSLKLSRVAGIPTGCRRAIGLVFLSSSPQTSVISVSMSTLGDTLMTSGNIATGPQFPSYTVAGAARRSATHRKPSSSRT